MHRSLGLSVLFVACAPQLVLPPVPTEPAWREPAAAAVEVPWPAAGAPPIRVDYDARSSLTRYAVTTHAGAYTGWRARPQLTFFAVTPGSAPPTQPPAHIGLVFRTLEPEAVLGSRLVLSCPDAMDSIGLPIASTVTSTGNTRSHFLTYQISSAHVAAFAACSEGTLAIAQIRVTFTVTQLSGLRALLLRLGATPPSGVQPRS